MTASAQTLHLNAALQHAENCRQAGLLQEAERLFRAILQASPTHPEANYHLGMMMAQANQPEAGLLHLKTALEANPDHGRCRLGYIDMLIQAGQIDIARKSLAQGRQRGLAGAEVEALAARLASNRKGAKPKHSGAIKLPPRASPSPLPLPLPSAKQNVQAPEDQEIIALAALFNAGRYAELDSRARLLIGRYPDYGLAWKALGASLQMQGKNALAVLQRAAELLPDDAAAHYNLGNTLNDIGKNEEAAASYRRALELSPDFAEALFNLGNALRDLRQFDDALAIYRRALEISPDDAATHNNLGNTLNDLVQFDQAMASFRRALEIKPDYVEAHCNLGAALQNIGQLDGAVESYAKALEIRPDYAEAHNSLGTALRSLGQLDGAVASYRRALEISQGYAMAHSNLGVALQDLGQLDGALASYRRALEIKPDYANALSNLLFVYNLLADCSSADMLAEARRFGELMARQANPYTNWHNTPDPDRCLRIGLVSGDLRNHPVGYFLESVLAALAFNAAGRVEIFAYPGRFKADALTERIKACCHGWHSAVGLSGERLARLIRDDGIDILIDLSGHTASNRLSMFAWKPAPVQVSWLGYFATTGVTAMDYFIADPWTLPESEEVYFTEKIRRLPETRLCFTPPDMNVGVSPLPALTNGYVTFGCFNSLAKMTDAVVALWARVLQATSESRLLLKTTQLGEATVRQRTMERFAAHGISADRLILEGFSPRAEYLASYRRVDIALDPFPYPGGTTSVEGLWMGVPLLTLAGERFLSRQGVGLLMNAGLPEWIAANADDYVARATLHADDLQRLAALRDGLRQQVLASPLFDAPRFAHHFEAVLRDMWREWCRQA